MRHVFNADTRVCRQSALHERDLVMTATGQSPTKRKTVSYLGQGLTGVESPAGEVRRKNYEIVLDGEGVHMAMESRVEEKKTLGLYIGSMKRPMHATETKVLMDMCEWGRQYDSEDVVE